MPSIILSDNGVSSGSAGLKSTAGNDGVLILQTTTSGGTATNAIYVDTSQLVGLGTTPAAKLHLLTTGNTTADGVRLTFGSEARSHNIYSALATGRDLTIAPYRALTINTGSGTNEGVLTLNAYEYTVFGTGSSYTERMRLDASGNLGVGTTSFSRRVNFAIADSTAYNSSSFEATPLCTYIRNTDATIGSYAGLQFAIGNNSDAAIAGVRTADASCAITFGTRNIGSGSIVERARIDSSGNLLVGTTTASGKLTVQQSATAQTLYLQNTNATTAYGMQIYYSGRNPNSTGEEYIYCGDSTNQRFVVRSNGGIANYSANNVNLSDRREKTNFAPAGDYLAKICAIPVQTFNYIDQNLEEDDGLTLGVVAQDVQAVAPELVMESNWAKSDEEPKMRLSIYQTDLQYALMKCIQELKAELDTAKAEIAALKGTQP